MRRLHDLVWNIVELINVPFLGVDDSFRVAITNAAFCRTFRVSAGEIEGCYLCDLPTWNESRLPALIRSTIDDGRQIIGAEMESTFPNLGCKKLRLNLQHLRADAPGGLTIIAIEDITPPGVDC